MAPSPSVSSQPAYYYTGSDPVLLKQQKDLQAQEDATFKTVLGPQLYAVYAMEQDPVYRSSKAITEQLGAPAEDIAPIYEITRATQAELERIRNDSTLTPDEKVDALAQTQVDQQQSIQQLLGPRPLRKMAPGRLSTSEMITPRPLRSLREAQFEN